MREPVLVQLLGAEVGFPRGVLLTYESADSISPRHKLDKEPEVIQSFLSLCLPKAVDLVGSMDLGGLITARAQVSLILQLWEVALEGQRARVLRSMSTGDQKVGEWKARAKAEAHPLTSTLAQEVALWRAVDLITSSASSVRLK